MAGPFVGSVNSAVSSVIQEQTLDSNSNEIEFTGLDLDADMVYEIHSHIDCTNTVGAVFRLFFNDDTVDSDYEYESMYRGQDAAKVYNADSDNTIGFGVPANFAGILRTTIYWTPVGAVVESRTIGVKNGNYEIQFHQTTRRTTENVESIRLYFDNASHVFKSGSKFRVFKRA